ncbi:MAG: hypothetical protein KAS12_04265 [Candidatus Aenigmarchaeota archaeon]|nr:hypothetical protein [Candidatus Aenigmarchaeota archaeon]
MVANIEDIKIHRTTYKCPNPDCGKTKIYYCIHVEKKIPEKFLICSHGNNHIILDQTNIDTDNTAYFTSTIQYRMNQFKEDFEKFKTEKDLPYFQKTIWVTKDLCNIMEGKLSSMDKIKDKISRIKNKADKMHDETREKYGLDDHKKGEDDLNGIHHFGTHTVLVIRAYASMLWRFFSPWFRVGFFSMATTQISGELALNNIPFIIAGVALFFSEVLGYADTSNYDIAEKVKEMGGANE